MENVKKKIQLSLKIMLDNPLKADYNQAKLENKSTAT